MFVAARIARIAVPVIVGYGYATFGYRTAGWLKNRKNKNLDQ